MIFYFSGTGNSEGIANIVAQALNDQAVNIVGSCPEDYHFTEKDFLGFVFPIYAYAAPEIMLQFAKKICPGSAFTFAICTFSNVAGEALKQFSEIIPLKSGYGIKMPDNYPILNKVIDNRESSIEKLRAAKSRLEQILPRISARNEEFDVLVGENGHDNTYLLAPQFNKLKRKTTYYWVEKDKCVHCGLCKQLCPAYAIDIREGFPVWIKEDCFMCMACINRCPAVAIEYGEYSMGKYRYYFRGFDLSKY